MDLLHVLVVVLAALATNTVSIRHAKRQRSEVRRRDAVILGIRERLAVAKNQIEYLSDLVMDGEGDG